MSGTHSILPPSGAAAWRWCALWVAMNQAYPKPPTPESMEGDAAHWVFAEMLAGRLVVEGQIAPNGIVISEEMLDGAELYCDTVRDLFKGRNVQLHVEERINIPHVHTHCFGTPDTWVFDRDAMLLDIVDYKFGHRFVDEYENDQAIAYASGVLSELSNDLDMSIGWLDQRITVRVTIVQPRCYYKGSPVRTWTVNASDLRGHINALAMAAEAALLPNPTATTNAECIDCPGRHACPALQKAAYSDAEFSAQSPPVELPPEAASLELKFMERALERLNARVEGMREAVGVYIKQGHPVTWHKAEQGFGRQNWIVPNEQVIAMGALFGADLTKVGVKTPKQAAKMLVDEAVIKAYTVTPLGQVKVVPNNPADARRVFGTTSTR